MKFKDPADTCYDSVLLKIIALTSQLWKQMNNSVLFKSFSWTFKHDKLSSQSKNNWAIVQKAIKCHLLGIWKYFTLCRQQSAISILRTSNFNYCNSIAISVYSHKSNFHYMQWSMSKISSAIQIAKNTIKHFNRRNFTVKSNSTRLCIRDSITRQISK